MKILAFDQSTVSTGWALYSDNHIAGYGTLVCGEKNASVFEKIMNMKNQVVELIKSNAPDLCCIEDIQFQNSYKVYKILAMLCGVLANACLECGVKVVVVSPKTWKSVFGVCGKKRDEQKESTINLVFDKYGLSVNTDEADAIGILHWAVCEYEEEGVS